MIQWSVNVVWLLIFVLYSVWDLCATPSLLASATWHIHGACQCLVSINGDHHGCLDFFSLSQQTDSQIICSCKIGYKWWINIIGDPEIGYNPICSPRQNLDMSGMLSFIFVLAWQMLGIIYNISIPLLLYSEVYIYTGAISYPMTK